MVKMETWRDNLKMFLIFSKTGADRLTDSLNAFVEVKVNRLPSEFLRSVSWEGGSPFGTLGLQRFATGVSNQRPDQ